MGQLSACCHCIVLGCCVYLTLLEAVLLAGHDATYDGNWSWRTQVDQTSLEASGQTAIDQWPGKMAEAFRLSCSCIPVCTSNKHVVLAHCYLMLNNCKRLWQPNFTVFANALEFQLYLAIRCMLSQFWLHSLLDAQLDTLNYMQSVCALINTYCAE